MQLQFHLISNLKYGYRKWFIRKKTDRQKFKEETLLATLLEEEIYLLAKTMYDKENNGIW
jgi:hypothetical protein